MLKVLLVYLSVVNAASFLAFGVDKGRARRGRWRIPERTLLWLSAAGGAAGSLVAMLLFRHKTRHAKFLILVPLTLLLTAAWVGWLLLSPRSSLHP